MQPPVLPVEVGMVVELRKAHPCGSVQWKVYRVGMDIGLRCTKCGRRVLIARSQFERQFRRFVETRPAV